jgi:hypothetical protein
MSTTTTKTAIAIALAEDPVSDGDIADMIENSDIPDHVKVFLMNL